MVALFSVPAFFILFRESLEASIILSVMLSLLDHLVENPVVRRKMQWQVWGGVLLGVTLSLMAGAVFISLYYTVAKDAWESSEPLWEGIFQLIAVILITVMALAMLRVNTWRAKWEKKLTKVTVESLHKEDDLQSRSSKYTLFFIPFTVVLREGVEAIIFLGGVGLSGSGTALPIPAVVGIICGALVGYFMYLGGNRIAFKWFLMGSSVFLLIIAAGLFAGSVHEFEEYTVNEHILWELHCCHHKKDGFWKVANAVVGWRDEATVGTLTAYISYWVFVILAVIVLRLKWRHEDSRASLSPEFEVAEAQKGGIQQLDGAAPQPAIKASEV